MTTKCPRALLQAASFGSIQTVPDDSTNSDNTPEVKKSKATPHQVGSTLQADVLIIEIDDGNDQQVLQMSKLFSPKSLVGKVKARGAWSATCACKFFYFFFFASFLLHAVDWV